MLTDLSEREIAARNEHTRKRLPVCMNSSELAEHYGEGIEAYFHYCRVLLLINLLPVGMQILCYSLYASSEHPTFDERRYWYQDFFISSFRASRHYNAWIGINITCIIVVALTLPSVLWHRHKKSSGSGGAGKDVGNYDDTYVPKPGGPHQHTDVLLRYNTDGTIDVSGHYRTLPYKVSRYIVSLLVFGGLMAIQAVLSYYITKWQEDKNDAVSAFSIALIVAGLNMCYESVCETLTELEKPSTMHSFKMSCTVKLLVFKLCNVITVYASKNYAIMKDCAYDVIGQQILYILVVDITLMNFFEVCTPYVTSRIRRYIAQRDKTDLQSDEDLRPSFDVSSEYLDMLYRQYLVYMAMVVFPLATCLAYFGQGVEYWIDKTKLVKIAGKPKRMDYSMKSQGVPILVCQIIILIAALFTPYAGVVWVLAQSTSTATAVKCTFP
eukprot:PhF_6_TR41691/c0_g1_i2/m.63239